MSLKQSKIMLADGFPAMPDFGSMEEGEATMADVYETQGIIAHVQKTLKADKAYNEGDKFIYKGVIYAATGSIAKNATIVLSGAGANVEAMDDIQTQIDNSGSGSYDFSTDEFDTGHKWIDGKTLYGRVLHFTEESEQTTKTYDISSSVSADFGALCFWAIKTGVTGNGHWLSGAQYVTQSYDRNIAYDSDAGIISVTCTGWGFTEVYCVIYYTKTAE